MTKEPVAHEISTPDVESFLAKPEFTARELIWATGLSRQTLKDYASRLGEPSRYAEEGQMFSRTVTAKIFRLPTVRNIQSALNKLEVIHGQKVYTHPQVALILGTEKVNNLLVKGNMSAIRLGQRTFYTHDMVENLQYLRNLEAKPAKPEKPQVHRPYVETEHGHILENLRLQELEAMYEKAQEFTNNPNPISSWPRLGNLLGLDARSAQILLYLGCQLTKQEPTSFYYFQLTESENIPYFRIPKLLSQLKSFLAKNDQDLYDLFLKLNPTNGQELESFERDSRKKSPQLVSTS